MDPQALYSQAVDLHRRNDLAQAEQLYRQVLRAAPAAFQAHYMLGVLQAQLGRDGEALASYDRAIGLKPDFAEALYNRGVVLWQMRRPADALASYDGALRLMPNNAGAHFNRGVVLGELARWEEAVASYDRALALQPDFAAALGNRGIALWRLKLHDAALQSYDKSLALQPDDARTIFHRGLVLADMWRVEDAVAHFDRALAIAPQFPEALASRGLALVGLERFAEALASLDASLALWPGNVEALTNRGLALWSLKRAAEAVESYDRALALQPKFLPAWNNRGLALGGLNRFAEALASLDKALALEPRNADIWNSRGTMLWNLKRPEEALASYNTAIAIRPDFAVALNNRGYMLGAALERHKEAIADYERVLEIDPGFPYARGELLQVKLYAGDWRDYDGAVAAIDDGVRAGRKVARPFIYQAVSQSPADLQACSRIFAKDKYASSNPLRPSLVREPATATSPASAPRAGEAGRSRRKIRIGYVSSDFREQATAYLTAGLYEHCDKKKFEIVAFDNGPDDGSPIRARLKAAFGKFIDISGLADDAAAEAIRAEKIDILVNLNGYFGKPRMGAFARRPAPLQVNWLGFPATLGAPYIDYIVADKTVIPASERKFYTEQVVWLPDSYQPNDSKRAIAADTTRAAQGLPDDAFVFCNFNQGYKIAPATFALWMHILKRSEGSVLWLLDGGRSFADNARREAERSGVAGERLIFAPAILTEEHLARLKLADLFLDSLPYNAHTTASDALWAGLPLLTLRGTAFAGRVAASLLDAAGLPELVTKTPEAFESLAVALAADAKKLDRLRKKLAKNRATCPLFDTARFTRHLEAGFATMWGIHGKGDAPRAFAVEPLA